MSKAKNVNDFYFTSLNFNIKSDENVNTGTKSLSEVTKQTIDDDNDSEHSKLLSDREISKLDDLMVNAIDEISNKKSILEENNSTDLQDNNENITGEENNIELESIIPSELLAKRKTIPKDLLQILEQDKKIAFEEDANDVEIVDAQIIGEDNVILKVPNPIDLELTKFEMQNIGEETPKIIYDDIVYTGLYNQTLGSQIIYKMTRNGKLDYIGCAETLLKIVPVVSNSI